MYLRREAYRAFIRMHNAAKVDGVNLQISSATRNFEDQKNIWNEQWENISTEIENNTIGSKSTSSTPTDLFKFKKILEFRSAPGTSRHHWGTDIDINRINTIFSNSRAEKNTREKIYNWLAKNAKFYGFCQTYSKLGDDRTTGYKEEPWHWSYVPLSKTLTQEYKSLIKPEDISGFFGDEYVADQDIINKYALSINPECL
jgi:LAS superfamily LD-carboxypeptidase LdcB